MAVDPLGNELDPTAVVVRDRNAGAPRGRLVDAVRLVVEQVLALVGFARARVGQRILPDPAPAVGGSGGAIPRGLVLRPALLGFAALVAIVVGDSLPSSPFKFEMPGAWFFGTPSSGGASGWGVYFVLVAVYGGLLLLMRVWWGMVRLYTRCPGASMRSMWWTFALWAIPMLVVAPLFSRDVYSYAAQGEMVSRHLNPYLNGPFQLGNNSYTAPVDPLWGNAPAPYGPLFLQMAGFFAQVSFHHELVTVVLLRLSALAGVVLIAVCVPRLARHYKRDSAQLFTLMVLNPVVILHLIGGAHNDALMLGLLVAGITLAKEKRPVVAVVLCTLATAIKAPAALGVVYVGWTWLGAQASLRERVRPMVTAGLMSLGLLEFLSIESGLGWGWVFNLGTPGVVKSWLAPTTELGFIGTDVAHFFHVAISMNTMVSATRAVGLLGAAAVGAWLLWNSDRVGTLKAMGVTLLAVVLLGPVDQPWYLSWGLVLLAPVAVGRLRSVVIGLSIFTAFLELPGATQLLADLVHGDPLSIALTLLWLLVILTVPLAAWEQHRSDVARLGHPVPVEAS
jgi:hypothetical protein